MSDLARVHLIGVGGSGMFPLALLLKQAGHSVTGSDDLCQPERLAMLRAQGIEAYSEIDPARVKGADCVVVSPAIPGTHAEQRAARRDGIPIKTRAQALSELIANRTNICVAGSHGKSTTTAMLVHILNTLCNDDFGYMLGAAFADPDIAPARLGVSDTLFVTEACEAHGALPYWRPSHVILTNLDDDHADHYCGLSELRDAFASLLTQLPQNGKVVACGDDPHVVEILHETNCAVLTYGFGDENQLRAVENDDGGATVFLHGEKLCTLRLATPGRHNLLNALAVLGMAHSLGMTVRHAAAALANFDGLKRRLQRIPTEKPWSIFDDFAHHPSEIAASLAALRETAEGRLIAIYEPQLHSRVTQMALPLAQALGAADQSFILPVAALGEDNLDMDGDAALADATQSIELCCQHVADQTDLLLKLNGNLQAGDTLVVMAGGNGAGIAQRLADALLHPNEAALAPSILIGDRRPLTLDLLNLVAKQAARYPKACAVEMGHRSLSYAELVMRAKDLASRLTDFDFMPGDSIGVCLGPSVDRVTAFLAILQLGGVFVPLDPALPSDRLRYMVKDAGVRTVIVNAASPALPNTDVAFLNCDLLPRCSGRTDVDWCPKESAVDALAYMIFTSGTTGQPKAVEVTRGALTNYALAASRHFQVTRHARVSQISKFGFDVSVGDMAMALASGACLVYPTDLQAVPGPPMGRFIAQTQLTHLSLTPTALAITPPGEYPQLTHVIVAGEACPPALVDRWGKGRCFINAYGPTEATVEAMFSICTPGTQVTIGRPIENMGACLMDDKLKVVAPGQVGELCLFGPGLAAGYRHQQELTEKQFPVVSIPRHGRVRIYRTGDLAKAGPDGEFVYLGRMDSQLKFKGHRIEAAEVEAALCTLSTVVDAAVSLVSSSHHPDRLVAHVVMSPKAPPPDPGKLREALLRQLPSYMVPSVFLPVTGIPRNANGKRDRNALTLPPQLTETPKVRATGTTTEATIMALIDEHVGPDVVAGTRDSLRESGVDSLSMANILFAIEEAFAITLDVSMEAGCDTIEVLALMVDSYDGGSRVPSSTLREKKLALRIKPHIAAWPGRRLGKVGMVRSLCDDPLLPKLFWCFQGGEELLELSNGLTDTVSVFGLRSGHLAVEYNDETLRTLGQLYADEITAIAPTGPLFLGGNCQGGLVMQQAGLELMQRGRDVALTILMEQGRFLHYPGPALLLFGEGSYLNPYGQVESPEQIFRAAYPAGHDVEIIPGAHGQYFLPENVEALSAVILRQINRRLDMKASAPEAIPPRQVQLRCDLV